MKTSEQQTTGQSTSSTESGSWQLKFILIVIAIGILGLLSKSLGLF